MKKIKPRFVYDEDGKKISVILTKTEIEKIIGILEDYEDYKTVKRWDASKNKGKFYTPEEVMAEILGKKTK
ncbi:MAG: hypothetical protein ABIA74_03575 [bacterium]